MWNGNEPFHALLLLFEAGEGGISDRKSGIGCIWVMVHILQKRKLLHILIQFPISFFQFAFSAPFFAVYIDLFQRSRNICLRLKENTFVIVMNLLYFFG